MSTTERRVPTGTPGIARRRSSTGWVYEARATAPTGKKVRKTLKAKSLSAAVKERRDWITDLHRGVPEAQPRFATGDTLGALLDVREELLKTDGYSYRTLTSFRERRRHLAEFENRSLRSITHAEVQAFALRLRKTHAATSVRSVIAAASAAIPKGTANPFVGIDVGKLNAGPKRNLGVDDVLALIDGGTEITRPLIATLVYSGARISEILGLRWMDVDLDANAIRISGQLQAGRRTAPKTEAGNRTLSIPDALVQELRRFRAFQLDRGAPITEQAFVFCSTSGKALDRRRAHRSVQDAARRSHLTGPKENLRPHDLRGAFALTALRAGADLPTVQAALGHESPTMSLAYAKIIEAEQVVSVGDLWASKPGSVSGMRQVAK